MDKLIKFGYCSKPHGIKGAFSFHLFNTEESTLKKGSKIILKPSSETSSVAQDGEAYEIATISFGNKVIATLKDVNDRNKVEELIPFEIFVERSTLPEPDEGEVYIDDLVGLEVRNSDGKVIGEVKGYYDNGAQTVLEISGEAAMDLPLVDHFFPEINIEDGFVIMNVPEGIE